MSGAQPPQGLIFGVQFTFSLLSLFFFKVCSFFFFKENISSVPSHVGTNRGEGVLGGAPAGTPLGPWRGSC